MFGAVLLVIQVCPIGKEVRQNCRELAYGIEKERSRRRESPAEAGFCAT